MIWCTHTLWKDSHHPANTSHFTVCRGSLFSTSLPAFVISDLFILAMRWCSSWWFWFAPPCWLVMLSTVSCTCLPFVCLLGENVYLDPVPIFFFLHRAFTVTQMLATGFFPLTFSVPQSSQYIPLLAGRFHQVYILHYQRIGRLRGSKSHGFSSYRAPQWCPSRCPDLHVGHL